MNLLAIDTSSGTFSLAVSRNGKVLKERNMKVRKFLSSSIIPRIDRILQECGLSLRRVDGFVVGRGPGSFTSLRVGLATVKGLAAATGKPVVGIPSLDAIASNVMDCMQDRIAVIVDARRKLVYACLYKKQGGGLHRKSPYLLVPIAEFLDRIQGDVLFVGDGIRTFADEIRTWTQAHPGIRPFFAGEKAWTPKAANLIPAALERFRKKKTDDVGRLVPLYLYPKECQVVRS